MRCTTSPTLLLLAAAALIGLAGCQRGMNDGSMTSDRHGMRMERNNGSDDRISPAVAAYGPETARITMIECDKITMDWPVKHKEAVRMMSDKYGPPSGATMDMVTWREAGPFKCITVFREEAMHQFPADHPDFLQHTIYHRIPSDRISDLTACDGSLYVDRTGGCLSAKCDTEAHNLLGFNIAHDIFTGKKTVQQAREAYIKITTDEKRGVSHPYLEKLQFQPGSMSDSPDPDRPTATPQTPMRMGENR